MKDFFLVMVIFRWCDIDNIAIHIGAVPGGGPTSKSRLPTLSRDANELLGAVCLVTRSVWFRRNQYQIHTINSDQKANTRVRAWG